MNKKKYWSWLDSGTRSHLGPPLRIQHWTGKDPSRKQMHMQISRVIVPCPYSLYTSIWVRGYQSGVSNRNSKCSIHGSNLVDMRTGRLRNPPRLMLVEFCFRHIIELSKPSTLQESRYSTPAVETLGENIKYTFLVWPIAPDRKSRTIKCCATM